MDWGTIANFTEAFAVLVGLIFAAWQVRDFRAQHDREAMLNLVQSFQSPSFAHALRMIVNLPDNADRATIQKLVGEKGEDDIYHITGTWESIGLLVFTEELTIEIVEDFFSGPILICWQKLERYIEEERQRLNRDTWSEWFEWLKDRIQVRERATPSPPAHVAHKSHRNRVDALRERIRERRS